MPSTPPSPDPAAPGPPAPDTARAAIRRQALSIALSTVPFGIAFGVAGKQAGLSLAVIMGFSTVVFTGGAQFAAVSVLHDGGSVAAAVAAGTLLNLRLLAFGMVMAPSLRGPLWQRTLSAHLVIDESTAVGSAQTDPRLQRYGFLAAGGTVFILWNVATLIGASVLASAGDLIERAGIDATIPAAFLALLWPRLADRTHRLTAVIGAIIATVAAPVLPAGVPILAAAGAVVVARPWRNPTSRPRATR